MWHAFSQNISPMQQLTNLTCFLSLSATFRSQDVFIVSKLHRTSLSREAINRLTRFATTQAADTSLVNNSRRQSPRNVQDLFPPLS